MLNIEPKGIALNLESWWPSYTLDMTEAWHRRIFFAGLVGEGTGKAFDQACFPLETQTRKRLWFLPSLEYIPNTGAPRLFSRQLIGPLRVAPPELQLVERGKVTILL
jgi:hypothetical protein